MTRAEPFLNILSLGNISTNVYTYTLDYSGVTDPPALTLSWPQDGARVSGSSFTLRGLLDDPTATVAAQITDSDGVTVQADSLVERNGLLWVENLPLGPGLNTLSLAMTNAAGLSSARSLSIVQSDRVLTIDDLSATDLNQPSIYVSGTISDGGYDVWVNGVQATLNGDGTWSAASVPVNDGGTAVIHALAILSSQNGASRATGAARTAGTIASPDNPSSPADAETEADPDKAPVVVQIHYDKALQDTFTERPPCQYHKATTETIQWDLGQAGLWRFYRCVGTPDDEYYGCTDDSWDATGVGIWQFGIDEAPNICGTREYRDSGPYTAPTSWPSEFCQVSPERDVTHTSSLAGHDSRKHTAHSRYELYTGGKGNSKRQNFFVLSATARGVGDFFWPEVDYEDAYPYDIAPATIVLEGLGQQGSDGRLYKVLPDNKTLNITPVVQGNPYYTFTEPSAAKHKLISYTLHQALTNPNRDRTKLGVGEEVSIYFDPELDMTFPETPWWVSFGGGVTPNVGSWVIFTAPSNAVSTTTVRVFVRDVQLDKHFSVVEPSGWDHAVIVSTNRYLPPMCAAGMQLKVFFAPTDVSLYRVEIEEVGEDATDKWGTFVGHPPEHDTSDLFTGLNDDNSWKGLDYLEGGAKYGYPGGSANPMNGWNQVFSIDDAGTCQIDKFGHWVRRSIDDVVTTH